MNWTQWIAWYGDLFGLVTDRDGAMMAAWIREVFVPQGFAPKELHAAGQRVACSDPPRFREQHLSRLIEEVRSARAAASRALPEGDDWSRCRDCGGTGLVSVPTLSSRTRGATQAVVCPCPSGRAFATRTRTDWMTLEVYETHNAFWRDSVAAQREDQKAYERAAGYSRDADQTLGEIVRRLAGKPTRR